MITGIKYLSTGTILYSLLLTSCLMAPKYVRPNVPEPPAYKESGSADAEIWRTAAPKDTVSRGKWWEGFHDGQLNALEEQVNSSNQNIAAAAAAFSAARAIVREIRSQYFPTVTAGAGVTNSRILLGQSATMNNGARVVSSTPVRYTEYTLPFDASWEPDLWGRVRAAVAASSFAAQASAADLENVRLTAQAEVAVDYYQLRTQDALKEIFDSTVTADDDSLRLVQAQYRGGIGNDEAVAQAETQLESARAEDVNVTIVRQQYEHAISVLIGRNASGFSIGRGEMPPGVPEVPAEVPSVLLERRPDIASAERLMAQANAQVGVAKAAFFPDVTLSASAGLSSLAFTQWLTWPSRFWSLGPSLVETVFDSGLRRATVQQYRAAYSQTVANYRQTVLMGFQEVEDNLVSARLLPREIELQDSAVQSAGRALQEATIRYQAGLDPYLNVLVAQTALLSSRQTAVNIRMQQITATIQLIKALGGGWDTSKLPSAKQLLEKKS